jgi:hypothetical protein
VKEKVATPVWKPEITAAGIRSAGHATPLYLQKLALPSPTSGGRSVDVFARGLKATELLLLCSFLSLLNGSFTNVVVNCD